MDRLFYFTVRPQDEQFNALVAKLDFAQNRNLRVTITTRTREKTGTVKKLLPWYRAPSFSNNLVPLVLLEVASVENPERKVTSWIKLLEVQNLVVHENKLEEITF